MSTIELTGARWSSAALCPRRAVYDHRQEPQDDATHELSNWRRRGHAVERQVLAELREGGAQFEEQREIPWPADDPIGVGHCDAYFPSDHGILEVTSTAGAALADHKAIQVAGYLLNDPDAEHAVVRSVDPASFDHQDYPISLEALRDDVEQRQAVVVEAIRSGGLPERTCQTPWDGPAQFCPYVWTVCFADEEWREAPADVLFAMLDDAQALADVTDDLADARRQVKVLTERQAELRTRFRPVVAAKRTQKGKVLDPGSAVDAGGVLLSRTEYETRSFSLSDYETAGHRLPPEAEEWIRSGTGERWQVKRLADREAAA